MTDEIRTARVTGAWYLGLAVTGVLGFLVVRPMVWVEDDPSETLQNLIDSEGLARLSVALEMGIVATQAIAAVYFFKLLRPVRPVAAVATASFGLVNAIAIMASTVFLTAAVDVAGDSTLAPSGDAASTVGLLYRLSGASWAVGALFFGLWLIPMGWAAVRSARFPAALGWTLIVGGAGYVLSAFVDLGLAGTPNAVVEALAFPANIGEFWIIGYLLTCGIRGRRRDEPVASVDPVPATV